MMTLAASTALTAPVLPSSDQQIDTPVFQSERIGLDLLIGGDCALCGRQAGSVRGLRARIGVARAVCELSVIGLPTAWMGPAQ